MNYSAEWPNTLTGSPMASQDLANRMAGPVLMGTAAQLFIAGSVYSNALQYWRSLPSSRDSKPLRFAIVAVLLLLSWACVMCVIDIWSWGVSQNRSAQGLEATSVMDAMTPLPAMLVGVLVQSVFVTRAMSLFTNRRIRNVWTVYMILAITMSFVGGIGTVAMDFRYAFNTVDDALPLNWDIVLSAWMWCSFIVDVSISITMCILLSSRLAGFNERTDSALMSLMYLSIESAVPTAIVALVAAIITVRFPIVRYETEYIANAFWYPLSSLHALSLFATLSARDRIRHRLNPSPINTSHERTAHPPLSVKLHASPCPSPSPNIDRLRPDFLRTKSCASDVRIDIEVESSVEGSGRGEDDGWDEKSSRHARRKGRNLGEV